MGGARGWKGLERGYCSEWGVGRSRLLPSAVEAVEGIPPTPASGRGEGHCSEEGEVTAVGDGVTPSVEVGGHHSEESGAQQGFPHPFSRFGSQLVGFPQISSERNGCQVCLSR